MINDIHKKMLNEILGRPGRQAPRGDGSEVIIIEKDKAVRKAIAELYTVLNETGQSAAGVKLLADHVAIMVDMINEFKKRIK
jgi:hypothetical protein